MSNETEAVKLARRLLELEYAWESVPVLSKESEIRRRDYINFAASYSPTLARALLATPQAEPQDEDVKRAYNLIENNLPKPMNWEKGCRAGLVNEIAAEFAAIRAERAAGWPGTVPSCPACASTSDVEWAVCPSPDNVCPLKRAKITPPQEVNDDQGL